MNNLPDSILEIANTCQYDSILKIFFSAIPPSKRNKVNMSQISETLKYVCREYRYIALDYLWLDRIYLLNSGKAMLVSNNYVLELHRFFGKSDNFPGNFRYLFLKKPVQICQFQN